MLRFFWLFKSVGNDFLLCRIFGTDEDAMLEDLEQGDVSETVSSFYARSPLVTVADRSGLQLHEVDGLLQAGLGKEITK